MTFDIRDYTVRTLDEVRDIMASRGYPMTKQAVKWFEWSAFKKLRRSPEIQRLWRECCND